MDKTNTVVSVGVSRTSNNKVNLEISDNHSGDRVIQVEFSLKEFGLLMTGLHGVKGEAAVFTGANIAKKREIKQVQCDKVQGGKDVQKAFVKEHFEKEFSCTEWTISDDGTRSQQNKSYHNYTVKRYVPVEDVYNVERYY